MDNRALWNAIKVGRNDRAVIIGKTGCGKTTLAEFLVGDYQKPYSVTWNPKGSDKVNEWKQKHTSSLSELMDFDPSEVRRAIYTPTPTLAEDFDNQEELFYWIYETKNRRVYIDEATSICYNGNKPPRFLTAILNRGRERGISSIVATQRPAGVPLNILTESEHYYVFRVIHPNDKIRIEQLTGISVESQADLNDFEFYYFNLSRGLFPRKLKLNLNNRE